MSKINVAVIGCGGIARGSHIPSYMGNPDVRIKYLVDILPEKAAEARDKFGLDAQTLADYHDILNDPELDAVSVCVPNNMHAPISIDFLNAGKNVLCEKPIATSFAEALAMRDAAVKNGKLLSIGVVNRFNTAVNKIKDLIDGGALGDIYHVYASFRSFRSIPKMGSWFTDKAQAGGGALIDWGVHFIDLLMYCIGTPEPRAVSGKTYCKLGKNMREYVYSSMWAGEPDYDGVYDVDDFMTGLIRFDNLTVSLNGAWAQNINESAMFIEFLGDKGGIKLQYGGDFKLYTFKDGSLYDVAPSFKKCDMFQEEINTFVRNIQEGTKSQGYIDNILVTQRLLDALYESSEKDREIVL